MYKLAKLFDTEAMCGILNKPETMMVALFESSSLI
jgi:hypothetical protein